MILLSHPTGNANIRHAARAFAEAGALAEFWTCLAWQPGSAVDRLLPAALRQQLARRSFPDLPAERVRTAPWRELGRFLAPRLGLSSLTRHEQGSFSVDAVYRGFARAVARRVRRASGLSGVYTGEDCALETFRAARDRGLHRIYDLPIGYWRAGQKIYREEAAREPAWAETLGGLSDSSAKLERKDAELRLAQTVVVASSFTRKTLDLAPASLKDIRVIPYGAPPVQRPEMPLAGSGKLRVLFAGALGQRKGLSYLLEAMRILGSAAELTLIGRKTSEICRPLNVAVREHRWIPTLSHSEVLAEMGRHDVLVFPSLFEGFGLVLLEALSRGLPVLATEHTGAPDILCDGVDGFIIPLRSASAIAERLQLLADDRARLAAMKEAALATAARLTWEGYRLRLGALAKSYFAQ